MEIIILPQAKADLDFWVKAGDKNILKKIAELSAAILLSPFEGVGKPEQLKYGHTGRWSRRINREHRLIYEVEGDKIYISSLKGHY